MLIPLLTKCNRQQEVLTMYDDMSSLRKQELPYDIMTWGINSRE